MLKHNLKVIERFTPNSEQGWIQMFEELIINKIKPFSKGKIILDAGCGNGFTEKKLAPVAEKIDAYDISKEAIDYADKSVSNTNINFKIKDFNRTGFKNNFYDLALSIEIIEHLKRPDFYLANLFSSLKNSGTLILSTPIKTNSAANPFHIKEYSFPELKELIQSFGFKIITTYGLEPNNNSKLASKHVPKKIINFVKKTALYQTLLKLFFDFSIGSITDTSSTMLFICKKS